MAVTVIPITQLVLGAESADLPDAAATAIATGADGGSVTPGANAALSGIILRLVVTTADTILIKAGVNPPAPRAGLGDVSVAMATSDVRFIFIEAARHQKADGSILITCTENATTRVSAFAVPKGFATIGVG